MATGIPSKKFKTQKKISISLTYEGKIDKDAVLSKQYPFFSSVLSTATGPQNHLFYGDNIDALLFMLNNGYSKKIDLIYIDPPFATEADFLNRNQEYAYSDSLCGGEFVEFLRQRLVVMYELLSDQGSIYLHLDNKMAFAMKLIMDEIFGENNCRSFITRKKCSTKNYTKSTYGNVSDYLMFYSKTDDYIWNRPYASWELDHIIEQYPYVDKLGRRYKKVPIHAPGVRNGETGKAWRGKLPPKGKHWQFTPEKLDELDAAGEIYWSPTGNPRRMIFCDPAKGVPVQDIWLNYRDSINQSQKTTGYPTEKNYDMLKMIVGASSNPDSIIMDCFAGSGTTLGAAYELGRHWIGVDSSIESLKAIVKRFVDGLDLYGDFVNKKEYKQFLLNLNDICPFDILSLDSNRDLIRSVLGDKLASKRT